MSKMVVELEWNSDLSKGWMNIYNLELLLYSKERTRRDLLTAKVLTEEKDVNPLSVKFKNLGGFIPKWDDLGNAALDLKASVDMTISSGTTGVVPLGIASEFGATYVALIKDRSGLASRGFYTHGGVIDSSYRGEWKVIMENATTDAFGICKGDRIAQVIFVPAFHLLIEKVDKLQDSVRGVAGFGSSGR